MSIFDTSFEWFECERGAVLPKPLRPGTYQHLAHHILAMEPALAKVRIEGSKQPGEMVVVTPGYRVSDDTRTRIQRDIMPVIFWVNYRGLV